MQYLGEVLPPILVQSPHVRVCLPHLGDCKEACVSSKEWADEKNKRTRREKNMVV